ncbi:MAG: nicotinate (nicotinamide) nucleotide adenylyltransferase [Planctomycetes bacterium B3_Pla]|nr:MAG: nicotinate (nicotinamide) nucleotide adenylyltransferase [Planctomycetes bacterium B3_Pla]
MAKQKTVLFGGTFDPIHLGHTTVAIDAAKNIAADKLVFVPAKRSPLKGFLPKASDDDRFEMIALAIAGAKSLQVSDYELRKPAPSYTLETVEKFKAECGGETSIYWLIGADGVDDLVYWHRIVELLDACNLATMYRAGCEPPNFARFEALWGRRRIDKLQRNIIQTPLVDISSTEIRNKLAVGQDAADMLHPAVADYIRQHGLYQPKETADNE